MTNEDPNKFDAEDKFILSVCFIIFIAVLVILIFVPDPSMEHLVVGTK